MLWKFHVGVTDEEVVPHTLTPLPPPPTPTRPLSLTTYYRQSRFPHTPLLTLPLHPPNLPGHIPLTPPPSPPSGGTRVHRR